MPDELTQLLDAWGRTQASAKKAGLLPLSPSAGYIGAVRSARYRRVFVRAMIVVGAAAALMLLVYVVRPDANPQSPAHRNPPVNVQDR